MNSPVLGVARRRERNLERCRSGAKTSRQDKLRLWRQWRCGEISKEPEVIASPLAIDRFVEDALAPQNIQRISAMRPEAHEDIADSPEGPIPKRTHSLDDLVSHLRVLWSECVAGITPMLARPGVAR